MQIAFEEHVTGVTQKDLAFMCEALNIQMREHLSPAWGFEGKDIWPVKAYTSVAQLPLGSFWPIAILPTLDVDNAAGYHDWTAGLAYGRVRWSGFDTTCVTASHEACELRLDPQCKRWVGLPDGRAVAVEISDPVENDQYTIPVTLFGETRQVNVSDFVLPSYFVENAAGPYSFKDNLETNAFDLGLSKNGGGYLLVREKSGDVSDYWGRKLFGAMKQKAPASFKKANDPHSRASRRLGGQVGELIKPKYFAEMFPKGDSK